MKTIITNALLLLLGAFVGWTACYYVNRARLFNVYTPEYFALVNEMAVDPEIRNFTAEDWKKLWSNISKTANACPTPNDELVLGMAYMAQSHFNKEMEDGIDAANRSRNAIITSFVRRFSGTNWGKFQRLADKIQSTANDFPEIFNKQMANLREDPTDITPADSSNEQGRAHTR